MDVRRTRSDRASGGWLIHGRPAARQFGKFSPSRVLCGTSGHYGRVWAASQDMEMPVHLHILTGFGASMHRQTSHGIKRYRNGVTQTREIEDALFDMIFSGVLERYPNLKIVSVENEVGWM